MRRLFSWLVVGLLGVAGCAPVSRFDPSSGRLEVVPATRTLEAAGARRFELHKRRHAVSDDAAAVAQVRRVVDRLAGVIEHPQPSTWEVLVFADKRPNAFALPGGKVGVHTGLLPITRDDAGLAAVLSHEFAHLSLNHAQANLNRAAGLTAGALALDLALQTGGAATAARLAAAGAFGAGAGAGVMLPHTRAAELEADKLGMLYMARAGYHPCHALAMWRRFATWRQVHGNRPAPEFLRTHPLDATRIKALEEYLPVALEEFRRYEAENSKPHRR